MKRAQKQKPYSGFFITLEGGEGAGKSTLAKLLGEQLTDRGYDCILTHEPGGTELAEKIRTLLLDPEQKATICTRAELFLFLAARCQHLEQLILPALHAGKVVICDRFSDSTIAYQGCARHLGMSEVEEICLHATHQMEPEVTFLLDLDPAVGLERVVNQRQSTLDRLEKEALEFHREVRQGFLHLADAHPERISVLDASQTPSELVDQMVNFLWSAKALPSLL